MRKLVRIGFPILCVAVVGGTLIAVGNLKKKADKIAQEKNTVNFSNMTIANNTNTNSYSYNNLNYNNVNTANTVKNTAVNNTVNNTQNQVTNTVVNQTQTSTNTKNTEETTEDLVKTSEKDRAVELVAKEWGEDSTVYFRFDGIDSNGFYIVAVIDKANTYTKMFYKVDLKNNTVEVDW